MSARAHAERSEDSMNTKKLLVQGVIPALLLSSLCFYGCTDKDSDTETVESGEMGASAGLETNDVGAEMNGDLTSEQAGAESSSGEQTMMSPVSPTEPVTACEDFGSMSCFANTDCAIDARCQDVGNPDAPVPCCVRGERGALEVGEACDVADGQLTCASSLCIANEETEGLAYCSGECLNDSECPENMPRCISIAFSGSDKLWCFPASASR